MVGGVVVEVLQHRLGGETAAVAAAAQQRPDEAPPRRERERNNDQQEGDHHDHRPGRDIRVDRADDRARAACERTEHGRENDHLAQLVGPLARGNAGSDQHPHHQDHAGQLQAEHNRHHDQGRKQHVEQVDAEAARAGELGVKGDQLELLPEQSQNDK